MLKVIVEGKEVKDDHALAVTYGFVDVPMCSSTTHIVHPPPPPPSLLPSPPAPILDVALPPPPHVLHATLSLTENVQPRRRKPCHGWICDDYDDEEIQFIILPAVIIYRQISPPKSPPPEPETPPHQQTQPELSSGRKNRPRH
ncbi:hypothetical protein Hanom_Chr07g00674461 [Helianthus anomalus]